MKESVIEKEYNSSKSSEEEVTISKYKKRSSGITISEPSTKKAKTTVKSTSVKRNIFIAKYIQWNSFSNLDFDLLELFKF